VKPAHLRPLAKQDYRHEVRYHRAKAGTTVAEQLVTVAGLALKHIEQDPGIGSPRLGLLAEIAGLRSWRVNGFALLWLYLERKDHLDVIRLLGERQDILSILGDLR